MGVDLVIQRLRAGYDRVVVAQSFGRSDRGCIQTRISTLWDNSHGFARDAVMADDRTGGLPTLSLDR